MQACLALGHIAKAYSLELEESLGAEPMISLYTDCWIGRLTDGVGPVREAAAIAIVSCLSNLPPPV